MLTVVATMKVKAGSEAQFEELISKLVAQTRQEPGTRRYQLFRSVEEPSTYLMYEQYEDKAAFESHSSSDHFKEFFVSSKSLMAGRPEVAMFSPAE